MHVVVGVVKAAGSRPAKTRDGEDYTKEFVRVRTSDELYPTKLTFGRDYPRPLPTVGDPIVAEVWAKPYVLEDGTRGIAYTAVRPLGVAELTEASGVGAPLRVAN